MAENNKPIGVFDSGIGGLSVLKQFIRFLPYENYIYLGDTARVPYGNRSDETVMRYATECTDFLLKQEVKLIVVACNTVSSVALDTVRKRANIPVIGMINPAAGAAIRASVNKKIGVIGTRATISSNAYEIALTELCQSNEIKVYSKACPLFVPLVEEGMVYHNAARLLADEYLEELKLHEIDTLVLGCTHYPLLSPLLTELLPGVSLIDSGEHAAVNAVRLLAEDKKLVKERDEYIIKPEIKFFVTDVSPTFYDLAQRFLGFPVDSPKLVTLE
jgi:glutamate racemase